MIKINSISQPSAEAPPAMPNFDDEKVVEALRRDAENPKPSKARAMARNFLKRYAPPRG